VSRPARVALLSSLHLPSDTRIFQKEARTLAAAGYDVTYVVPHDRDEEVKGVHIRAFHRPGTRLQRIFTSSPRMLWAAAKLRADVYHFHDPELIPVGLVLKLLGRRVIYDAHEDVPKSLLERSYLPRWVRRPLALMVGLAEKAASRAFDLVVVAGEGIQESFRGHARTLLIRNYPIEDEFRNGARSRSGSDGFNVIYTGALTPIRGAVEMVEAIGMVAERYRPRLIICGKYHPTALAARVRQMAGFSRVDFRGQVDYEAMPEVLARADVGLVCFLDAPNHVNSGPTKLFEYMAAGLPVIASDFPTWREIVEGNECGLCVDPTDPAAIAAAIEHLAEHPERRAEMGANGRRAVLARYNWQAEGRRLIEAYARLYPPSSKCNRIP
jgi:glycosyltransferase involved in cell wall biosynthesis